MIGMEGACVGANRKEKTKKQVATRELLEFNWSDSLSMYLFFCLFSVRPWARWR